MEEAHAELGSSLREINTECVKTDNYGVNNEVDFKPAIENILFNESHFEPELSIKEANQSEALIDANKIVIKEEEEMEEQSESITTIRSKRTRRQRIVNDKNDCVANEDPLSKRRQTRQNNAKKEKVFKSEESKENPDTEATQSSIPDRQQLEPLEVKYDPEEFLDVADDVRNDDTDTDSNYEMIVDTEKKSPVKRKKTYHANDKFLAENFKIICSLCQIQAETFHALCKHFKMEHKQIGYVMCCKKKFYRRSILVDHVHQHVDPNYFKCTICDKVMADRKCLNMHNKTHNDKKEKTHACEICNKKFSMHLSLKLHKMSHLSEEEKHIPCAECGKK